MKTITKKELVHRIAEQTSVTKVVAKDVIQSFLNAIIDELANGNRLEFREFGVFESRERAARLAQNPRTLEKVPVPVEIDARFVRGEAQAFEDGAERGCDFRFHDGVRGLLVAIDSGRRPFEVRDLGRAGRFEDAIAGVPVSLKIDGVEVAVEQRAEH